MLSQEVEEQLAERLVKRIEETKKKCNNDIIDNTYFTEIRDKKGNLKGVKYGKYHRTKTK